MKEHRPCKHLGGVPSRPTASHKNDDSRGKIVFDGYWFWILSPKTCDYEITGKYLFYSKDRKRLIEVAVREILHHHFHEAKVNSELLGTNDEYGLCLYYKDDSRKHELADRCREQYPDLKYRYWKSNAKTLRGEYSEEFLAKLDAKTKVALTTLKQVVEFKDPNGKIILKQEAFDSQSKTRKTRK
jgi:hypothetical protein